jgi:pilus assembly protein CpaE
MRCGTGQSVRDQTGQASVELVGVLPAVLLAGLVAWQLALVGHTAWLVAGAARSAARAEAVGRDADAAARSALPATLERGLRVERDGHGGVRVRARVPLVLTDVRGPVALTARARLGAPP